VKGALGAAIVALTLAGCAGDNRSIESEAPDVASTTSSAGRASTVVDSSTITDSTGVGTTQTGRQPEGFTTVTLELTGADPCCVWLADSPEERSRGLMEVTDLGEPVGMLFAYPEEGTSRFYMFNTVLPLSIAFFDGDGRFVSSTDMEPCRSPDPVECPRYPAVAPFRYALEVPQGGLDDLGIGSGTTIAPGAEAANCAGF